MTINVTVWNENYHDRFNDKVKKLYPNGLHGAIAEFLSSEDIKVRIATLDMEEQGLTDELLDTTDVLIWWGHMKHSLVSDELVTKIRDRVYSGKMGFIPLHSAHHSKPFMAIIGTTGDLTWGRNQHAVVWNLAPTHPITQGIPAHFDIQEELYSEPFFVPKPDDLLFGTWYEDGNIFRGGMTFTRGLGKIFYFHPGHETCDSFYNEYVRRIIKNAVYWCAPVSVTEGFNLNGCVHQTEPIFIATKEN